MRNLETAASRIEDMMQQHVFGRDLDSHGWAKRILSAQFVAEFGCEHCDGTGLLSGGCGLDHGDGSCGCYVLPTPCPAAHVELPNLYDGTTAAADPDKVEWLCIEVRTLDGQLGMSNLPGGPKHCYFLGTVKHLPLCRYVPKPLEVDLTEETP